MFLNITNIYSIHGTSEYGMTNYLYFIEGYKHSVLFGGTSEDVLPGTSSLATLDSLSCRTLAMSVPALLLLMLLAEYISNSNNKTIYMF